MDEYTRGWIDGGTAALQLNEGEVRTPDLATMWAESISEVGGTASMDSTPRHTGAKGILSG